MRLLIFTLPLCSLALSGLLISLGARAENVQQTPPSDRRGMTESHPALEPKAIALLKAMSSRLAAARTIAFTAVTTYESPSRIGPPLVYTTLSEVTLQRPDKLRVIVPGDGSASEFYYDGKTMVAYAPGENLVAVAKAPSTIDAALKEAYDLAAIYFPFTDAIVADPYQDIADGLKQAFYIGQSRIVGGTTTDMIAIANDQVFAQIWIGTDDKLPRAIRVVYRDDPSRLRHQVEFSNWHLDKPISADTFASSRASSAPRIQFTRPEPKLSGNSMSPGRVEPTKIQELRKK